MKREKRLSWTTSMLIARAVAALQTPGYVPKAQEEARFLGTSREQARRVKQLIKQQEKA